MLALELEVTLTVTTDAEIIVADVSLLVDDAWRLLTTLHRLLTDHDNQMIHWKVEGF
jgi:hypothetical protein